ncbi:hypothetical protein BLA33_04675 (plasmid) [Borreliella garinii]|nr:hypothetical protein BLA33_04675 [Borreliella garinii]AZA28409.1 hypothetical protein DB281_05120 [Borreliella garinii]
MCNAERRIPTQCYKKCCSGAVRNHGRGEKKRCFSFGNGAAGFNAISTSIRWIFLIICVLFPFLISIKIGPQKVNIYTL